MTNKRFFQYYGGKQRLAKTIVELLPPHTAYVEAFGGSLAVLFEKGKPPVPDSKYFEVANDTNRVLVEFYKQAWGKPFELLRLLTETPYSKQEYDLAVEITNNPEQYERLSIAWAVWVNANFSFSGKMDSGFSRSKTRNKPATARNRLSDFLSAARRIENVYFDSVPALELIPLWDSAETVFYLDPPYPQSSQGHYSGYTEKDFQNLIDLVDGSKGSFVISNYEQPGVSIPSNWKKVEVPVLMSATKAQDNHKPKRVEILWVVDRSQDSKNPQKLWSKPQGKWVQGLERQGELF